MNIVLCGMMGSGKTTVAYELSKTFNLKLIDTDALIVERYGNIDDIFAGQGEAYFRNLEAQVTAETAKKYDNAVISLGGGCVLRKENVDNLKASGKIVYLRATAGTIINRLKGDTSRPLLKGGLEERVKAILAVRSDIYEAVSDYILDTDVKTPQEIAKEIIENTGFTAI